MCVYFHLLAEGTASDKSANKQGYTRPPVVLCKEQISMEESPVSRGKRRVNRGNEVLAGIRRNIKVVFEIKFRIRKVPVIKGRMRKQRRTVGKILKGRNNQWVQNRGRINFVNEGGVNDTNKKIIWEKSNISIIRRKV